MPRFRIAAALACCLALGALPALAATFENADSPPPGGTVRDDLYIAGQTVQMDRDVQGDLIAAGGNVTITKKVQQDVIAAGGSVTVLADIGDDLRAAGGDVAVRSKVGGDVVILGGTVLLESSSVVGRDLIVTGGEAVIHGKVLGNVRVRGGKVTIDGTVNGNLIAEAGEAVVNGRVLGYSKIMAEHITLGQNASFGKTVEYWRTAGPMNFGKASSDARFSPGLQGHWQGKEGKEKIMAFFFGTFTLFSFLSAALFMGILVLLTKKYFTDVATALGKSPWWSMLYGLMYVVIAPVLCAVLLLTVIGIPLGLFLFMHYVFSLVFALPIAALVIAKWLQMTYRKKWSKGIFYLASLGVFIVLKLLVVFPVVGWSVKVLIILAVFGALITTKTRKWKLIA